MCLRIINKLRQTNEIAKIQFYVLLFCLTFCQKKVLLRRFQKQNKNCKKKVNVSFRMHHGKGEGMCSLDAMTLSILHTGPIEKVNMQQQ